MKNKRKKITFKKFKKIIFKKLIYFLVGIGYLIFMFFQHLNKLIIKMFKKLPKWFRILIIYLLVIGNIPHLITTYNLIKNFNLKTEKIVIIEKNTNQDTIIVEKEQEKETCTLNEIECKIFNKAIEKGMTKEQAFLSIAISKHETGNWTSQLFIQHNNFGGLYNSVKNVFCSYETQDYGLEVFLNNLKNWYFDKGLNTIEKIGNVYCPIGADNDPTNLNQYWIPRVSQYYNEYLEK